MRYDISMTHLWTIIQKVYCERLSYIGSDEIWLKIHQIKRKT